MHKEIAVAIYVPTRRIWGVYSSEKKAAKDTGNAVKSGVCSPDEFEIRTFRIDYRLKAQVKYYDSKTSKTKNTATLAGIGGTTIVDRRTRTTTVGESPDSSDNVSDSEPLHT